jgi:hypothetical protein
MHLRLKEKEVRAVEPVHAGPDPDPTFVNRSVLYLIADPDLTKLNIPNSLITIRLERI